MKMTLLARLVIVVASCYVSSCVYRELPTGFDCSTSNLAISLVLKLDATSCKSIDGQIVVAATGGKGAYDFSLGDGVYQTNPEFNRLAPGSYSVTVKDIIGCKQAIRVDLSAGNSTLAATTATTPDNQCLTDNGSITVTCSGGSTPYLLKIDAGTFAPINSFPNLKSGNHTIIIKDNDDCERVLIVAVPRGDTGVSLATDIMPIFTTNCTSTNGCHGPGNTGRDWTKYSDIKAKANDIKNRTASRSMPIGGFILTQTQISQIACWVDDGANNN